MRPLGPEDPRELSGYRLLARIGEGGMGSVYLSRTRGNHPVALKVIRREYAEDAEFRRRFEQEAQSARQVQGYHIVPVVDHDTTGAQPWLATTYIPGLPLDDLLSSYGPLPVPAVLQLVGCAAEALRAVHAAGVIHRDMKPSNILIGSDGPWVIDFGIARAADATQITRSGGLIGTPQYMSPEHANGHILTPATDIFSLGLIAAVAATGRHPYGDGGAITLATQIANTEIRPPDLTDYPEPLREVLERCLTADPAARPAPAELAALCEVRSGRPLRDFGGWLPAAVAAEIGRRAEVSLRLPEPEAVAATVPPPGATVPPGAPAPAGYASTGFAPARPPQYAPLPTGHPGGQGHAPAGPPSQPYAAPQPYAPTPPPATAPAPARGRKALMAVAAAVAVVVVAATAWVFTRDGGKDPDGKAADGQPAASTAKTPDAKGSPHPSKESPAADPAGSGGATAGESFEAVYEGKPFALRWPSAGYTHVDLDTPTVTANGSDFAQTEWVYSQWGTDKGQFEMVFRTTTGKSNGTSAAECRSAADTNALSAKLDSEQIDETFVKGAVLCTVTQQGNLAMFEITEAVLDDGRRDFLGKASLWKLP